MTDRASAAVASGYDVIGDVHGHADKLEGLLRLLDYRERDGVWEHPERIAVFVGDLIDRGPYQLRTIEIVRPMIEAGAAKIVMGNHEFNAIAWMTDDPLTSGDFMRPHAGDKGAKNRDQHARFLEAVGDGSDLHVEQIDWFRSFPLWLDLGEVRVIHACWNESARRLLEPSLRAGQPLSDEWIVTASRKGTAEYEAVEVLLKGPEIDLPEGRSYLDKDGHERKRARLRWWDDDAHTLRQAAEIPPDATTVDDAEKPFPSLPDTPIAQAELLYTSDVPVIFGHYWRTPETEICQPKIACVDFSAGAGKPLVAYRWSGGDLDRRNFVSCP